MAALGGVPLLLGALWASARLARRADAAADEANSALTERIIEFARTQQALRAARRVEPARSLVGDALAAQHGATMRLLSMQVPGQLLFSLASQLALILLAGATTRADGARTLTRARSHRADRRDRPLPGAVHHISELAPALESTRATLGRIRAVLTAPLMSAGHRRAARCRGGAPYRVRRRRFGYDGATAPVLDGVSFALAPAARRRSSDRPARARAPSWR